MRKTMVQINVSNASFGIDRKMKIKKKITKYKIK